MSGRCVVSLIAMQNVSVAHGKTEVLEDVTLDISRGEIVTIVGPNGSGKSTLLKTIIGAVKPRRGRVIHAKGLSIGYVPQTLRMDASLPMTVTRFMGLPNKMPADAIATALDEAGVSGFAMRQMADLSGGQFQRVMLARAILNKPDILLLDEPTQGLDQPGSAAFYQRIETLRDRLGCAVLMVSHDLHVVMSASDRVVCLNGHVCCAGRPEAVASAPEYRALFGTGTGGALALYRHEHTHHHHHHDPAEAVAD